MKISAVLFVVLLLHGQALFSQKISIRGTVIDKVAPKYVYWNPASGNLQKQALKDGKFSFAIDSDYYQDSLVTMRLTLTDLEIKDGKDMVEKTRSGTVSSKNFFYLLKDTSAIALRINVAQHRMEADATVLNEQFMKLRDIYWESSVRPFAEGETANQRNDWIKNAYLEVISKYPSSIVSYDFLDFHVLNGLRDYENRVAIKDAIDQLDSNYIKPHLIKSLYKKYDNMIVKNQDKTNMPFPAVALLRADGEETSVERLRKASDLLVIDFWATWCGPCIQQQPVFEKVKDNFKDRGQVKFLSISLDKKKTDWDTYSQKHVFTYESYWVNQIVHADFTAQLGIQSIPRYMLVDSKTGTIIKPKVSIEALQAEIEAFLSDKKPAITAL